jgi:glucokinase
MVNRQFIGIEIGGSKLQLVRADASFAIQQTLCLEADIGKGATSIRQQIEGALEQIRHDRSVSAIGVGFGGPVNHITGKVSLSHQVAGWETFDLRQWLKELTGAPVFIDNDANVAALAEAIHGAGKPFNIVFYMTIGSGIGGGLVLNKKIYHGTFPGEAEIGHLRLNKEGDTLESLCCGWAVDQSVRKVIKAQPHSALARFAAGAVHGEARFLVKALQENDIAAKKILLETADNIAFGLSHVVHLFHPEILIIGGGLSLLGKYLSDAVSIALPRYLMDAFLPPPPVVIAALGKQVVPVGALELAKRALLAYTQETDKNRDV